MNDANLDDAKKQVEGGFHEGGSKQDEKLPENSKENLDRKLDDALGETSSASDPISVKITK